MRIWGIRDRGGRGAGPQVVVVLALAVLASVGSWAVPVPASAAPGDVGIEGPAYVEGSLPTVTMAESKLWFHDGSWYAAMLETKPPSSGGSPEADVVIHRRVGTDWVSTGTVIDPRSTSKQDVVAVGDTLYVLSHRKVETATGVLETDPNQYTRLAKLTYDTATDTYVPVSGFPKVVNRYKVESATIDVDSTGALWVAWAQQGDVLWQRSTDEGATWSDPTALTVAHSNPSTDDIASLVAYGDRVGIMWAGQTGADDGYWFTSTAAGAGTPSWTATEPAYTGAQRGDDHINLKAVGNQVVAVVKTRIGLSGNPLVVLLQRGVGGTWTSTNAWAGSTKATRPIVMVDTTGARLHLFATLPNGTTSAEQGVYTKTTSLVDPSFDAASPGTPAMTRTGGDIADVTGTKQGLTATTDLVALAADTVTQRYWTHAADIAVPVDGAPSAPASVTATAARHSLTVSWAAATPGSIPITGYRITATPPLPTPIPDQPASARGPITVTLPTGSTRTFHVQALAGVLTGPTASSGAVTPNNHEPFASTDAFAERQALDFFGRAATTAEKAAVARILGTEDQAGSAAVLGPELFAHADVAGPTLRGLQAQVARLYVAYFLRAPDTAGLDYWIAQRRSGWSIEQVSGFFAKSKEFRTLYGANLSNGGYVDLVYQNVLGRAPDAGGRAYWISELERGISRGRMMTLFAGSQEYIDRSARTVSVSLVYRWMLGRAPTTSELTAEAGKASMAVVVDDILASTAYRNRVAT